MLIVNLVAMDIAAHKTQNMTDKYHNDRSKEWQIIAV